MANPSYSNIHPVNEILRNLAIEAIPSDGQLIADQVIEAVDVKAIGPTGTLLIEETRNFMGSPDVDAQRAPGAALRPGRASRRAPLWLAARTC